MAAKTVARRAGVSALCAVMALGTVPVDAWAKPGPLIDHIQPRTSYPANVPMQDLLRPANLTNGVILDPQVSAYPQSIINKLLTHWDGVKPPAPVFLVPAGDFTSDVSDTGAIFLDSGLIQYFHDHPEIQSEDALAFVLAHELSHVLLGHTATRQRNTKVKNYASTVMKWGSIVGGAVSHAGTAAGQALMSGMWAKAMADTALFPSWTRKQEVEADTLAIDLMKRSGYSLGESLTVGDVLVGEAQRTAREEAAKRKSGPATYSIDNVTVRAQNANDLDGALIYRLSSMAQEHPHAEERRNALQAYINRVYGDQDDPTPQRGPLLAWVRSAAVSTFVQQTKLLVDAEVPVKNGNWSVARGMLSRIGAPVNQSELWIFMHFKVELNTGQGRSAYQLLSRASARQDVIQPVAIEWGRYLSNQGQWQAAEKYMADEQGKFEDRSFLPERLRNARKAKDSVLAIKLMGECEGIGDNNLENACNAVPTNP